jgi:hypothetical protein
MTSPATAGSLPDFAKTYLLAQSEFNRAYCRYLQSEVRCCSDETGWKLLEVLRANVTRFRFKMDRNDSGIPNAAWELFRCLFDGKADYTFDDAVAFVKWYARRHHQCVQIPH